jgi:hypothetical protein
MSLHIKLQTATALLSSGMLAPLLGQSLQESHQLHISPLQEVVVVQEDKQANMAVAVVELEAFSLEL